MPDTTDRLALPLLAAGQAQKEITHNEALVRADILIQPAIVDAGVATPPASPAVGQCWIVGASATGEWAGQEGRIAAFTSGGWVFLVPQAGWRVCCLGDGTMRQFDGAGWSDGHVDATSIRINTVQVVGAQQPAISSPSGGSVVDTQARIALSSLLVALRSHGLIGS